MFLQLKASKFLNGYKTLTRLLETWFLPIFDLFVRLWMASIFWRSGVLKLQSWENTVTLFTYEHPVPLLIPEIAAFFFNCV